MDETQMLFLCSCGAVFDIGDSGGMSDHLVVHPDHSISERVVNADMMPTTLTALQDSLVVQIRTKRDKDRLEQQVLAEYPPGSGKLWRCGQQSQSDWASLVTLDERGLVVFPFRVYTWDERNFLDIESSQELTLIVQAVSQQVLQERAQAQTFVDAVLAATTEEECIAAADPYLSLP